MQGTAGQTLAEVSDTGPDGEGCYLAAWWGGADSNVIISCTNKN